jgi:epoxyqueuosine reductase
MHMILETIKENLVPSDDYIFGVSDLKGLINRKYDSYPFGISIGKRLEDRIIDGIVNGPTIEYYNHYNQINNELHVIANTIKAGLHKINVDSIVVEPTVPIESKEFEKYLKTLTVDVSHKMVATRAGLGWIGKTDLLISKAFGPRVRLVSLLIDHRPMIDSKPADRSKCGRCNICVDMCPANAANGRLWNTKVHRDSFFDAHKCREKCGELARHRLNVDKRICGLCVAVCPVGKKKK